MKKKFYLFLFALVVLGTAELHAGTREPNITLEQKGEKTYVMRLGSSEEDMAISIKDNNGMVLYNDIAPKGSPYQKAYDFSQLPGGNYFIEVENDYMIKTAPINVTSEKIFVLGEHNTVYKPVLKVNGDFLDLNFLNLDKKKVSFEIYNSKGSLVYSQDLDKDITISRRFNVSKLPSDNYSVLVYNNDRLLTKNIVL